jgi:hypothetical protein
LKDIETFREAVMVGEQASRSAHERHDEQRSTGRMSAPSFPTPTIDVEPWTDPVIDQLGHDPRSPYVEKFWLAILGPSTVWLLRRLAEELDRQPQGFTLDVAETAQALGVGMRGGRNSPFMRSLERSCRFGAARFVAAETLAVRRKLPPLNRPQVQRLPVTLQEEHQTWIEKLPAHPDPELMKTRARQLALSLLELGEDRESTERQLHRWRFHPAVSFDAVRWAEQRQADGAPSADDTSPPT